MVAPFLSPPDLLLQPAGNGFFPASAVCCSDKHNRSFSPLLRAESAGTRNLVLKLRRTSFIKGTPAAWMWLGKVVEAEIREASFRMQTGDATGLCTRSQAAYFCCIDSMVLVTESNLTSPKSISDSTSWKIGPQTGISRLPCASGPGSFPSMIPFTR